MPDGNDERIEIDIEADDAGSAGEAAPAEEHDVQPAPGAVPRDVEEPEPKEEAAAEADLRAELEHLRDRYLRKLAEFDNFRKRTEREKSELWQQAAADLIGALVPVLDNFELALRHADADPESLRQGVEMIARQLWDILERQGLERIDPLGQAFDPELHEAVQRVEDSEHQPGTVTQVLAKGYRVRGRLVRPAMVAVAVEPAPAGGGDDGAGEAREGGGTA